MCVEIEKHAFILLLILCLLQIPTQIDIIYIFQTQFKVKWNIYFFLTLTQIKIRKFNNNFFCGLNGLCACFFYVFLLKKDWTLLKRKYSIQKRYIYSILYYIFVDEYFFFIYFSRLLLYITILICLSIFYFYFFFKVRKG